VWAHATCLIFSRQVPHVQVACSVTLPAPCLFLLFWAALCLCKPTKPVWLETRHWVKLLAWLCCCRPLVLGAPASTLFLCRTKACGAVHTAHTCVLLLRWCTPAMQVAGLPARPVLLQATLHCDRVALCCCPSLFLSLSLSLLIATVPVHIQLLSTAAWAVGWRQLTDGE
jgi:hypothetical protein